MDPLILFQLLGAGPGPAIYHPAPDDDATAAAMVNGANGVNGSGGSSSSSSSSADSAADAESRKIKRPRVDS